MLSFFGLFIRQVSSLCRCIDSHAYTALRVLLTLEIDRMADRQEDEPEEQKRASNFSEERSRTDNNKCPLTPS